MSSLDIPYLRNGAEIYRMSFATIRAETDLSSVPPDLHAVIVRMIHACGMVDLVADAEFDPAIGKAARAALAGGAAVLTDSEMLAAGITRSRLPMANLVICTLGDPGVAHDAERLGTTRSAAAVDRWIPHLGGAVVAIGNAPTALFRLLELLGRGAPRPAAIVGAPVGFVGAAESKRALASFSASAGLPWLTVHGRRGGTAIAAAAINALASERE